jgi:hypothetical protein
MMSTGLKCQGEISLGYQYTLKKYEGHEGKTSFLWGWILMRGGRHKERVNDSDYCGCILY